MDAKEIIKGIRVFLDDELVSDTEIDCITDGTADIVRGRKELAISLIDRINIMESNAFKRIESEEIINKEKEPNFDWGVFIEWYDDNGQEYEVMLSEELTEKVFHEINNLLKNPKKSKARLLAGMEV